VHERGQTLAAGERQQLALARAFLARPRVLILDEATSSLDLQSETVIERPSTDCSRDVRRSSSRTASRPPSAPTASS
jgi:ABC-type multidrug transport system fused ATPase/permease subunit